ncbi:MAG: DinB family protein [Anaerolineales bacterium]|nr:DinB family protein [Anaerolineales bacterium]
MALLLVDQLHFVRSELVRCMDGVTEREALIRLGPMNSLGWIVGHLASQENFYWVRLAQGLELAPGLDSLVGFGKPATTPMLKDMWAVWLEITKTADVYLNDLTEEELGKHFHWRGKARTENVGTKLLRNLFHYWYHIGEAQAIRQQLGHKDLPQFVGDFGQWIYRAE